MKKGTKKLKPYSVVLGIHANDFQCHRDWHFGHDWPRSMFKPLPRFQGWKKFAQEAVVHTTTLVNNFFSSPPLLFSSNLQHLVSPILSSSSQRNMRTVLKQQGINIKPHSLDVPEKLTPCMKTEICARVWWKRKHRFLRMAKLNAVFFIASGTEHMGGCTSQNITSQVLQAEN